MSKSPRTDEVWERIATDTTGELEPDVEFSTLARQLEHELYESKEHIKRLEDWKQSALSVEREWDANLITTMLGGKLGESHRKVIQREVPKLLVRIKWLQEAFDAAEGLIAVSSCGCPYGDEVFHCSSCIQAINRYHKAKKNKP